MGQGSLPAIKPHKITEGRYTTVEWNSIKEKATETAAAAAELAKAAAKTAKLNLQIAAEQDKIKKAQLELGKLCHQDYVSGEDGDLSAYLPWHQKIDESAAKIAQMREELRRLRESRDSEPEVSDEIDYALNDMQYNPHDDAPVVDTIDTEGKEEQARKREEPEVSDEIDYALNDMQYDPHDDAPLVDTIDTEGKEAQK